MPVEIAVLSGSRQGETLRLQADRITVGDQGSCDVHFAAGNDPGASGRYAVIAISDASWQITNQGEETLLVNHQPLPRQASQALRSGDIVRLSDNGPDFMFSIVAARSSTKTVPTVTSLGPRPSPSPSPLTAAAVCSPSTDTPLAEDASGVLDRTVFRDRVRWMLPFAVIGLVLIVVVAVVWLRSPSGKMADSVKAPQPTTTQVTTVPSGIALNGSTTPPVVHDPLPPVPTKPPVVPSKPKPRPPKPPAVPSLTREEIAQKYAAATVWLGLEAEGFKLPLCSGWAIAPNQVVSTAQQIAELKAYQGQGGVAFAFCEGCEPKFVKITAFAVHPRFNEADPVSSASRLHNVGVVTLERPVPVVCPLQTSHETGRSLVDSDVTIMGFAFPFDSDHPDKQKPYDKLHPPRFFQARGLVKGTQTVSGASDDDLPLLVLEAQVASGAAGAPVFNSAGKVVAVLYPSRAKLCAVLSDQLMGWR